MMKKIDRYALFVLIIGLFLSAASYAICPICTVAVGAGIGLSHWLGVDDTISGLWVGGFIVSLIVWTLGWLKTKNIHSFVTSLSISIIYYAIIISPLYPMNVIGHPLNRLWGIDKLLLGIIVGSIAFYVGYFSYLIMKKKHHDKAYFPFQKVVMPIIPLIIFSMIFHVIVYH